MVDKMKLTLTSRKPILLRLAGRASRFIVSQEALFQSNNIETLGRSVTFWIRRHFLTNQQRAIIAILTGG